MALATILPELHDVFGCVPIILYCIMCFVRWQKMFRLLHLKSTLRYMANWWLSRSNTNHVSWILWV